MRPILSFIAALVLLGAAFSLIHLLSLRLDLPDRWGSDAIFMRIKRDEAIATGDPAAGIEVLTGHHPDLLLDPPRVTAANVQQAVDLAKLMQLAGQQRAEAGIGTLG